jgi:hypothetical protein
VYVCMLSEAHLVAGVVVGPNLHCVWAGGYSHHKGLHYLEHAYTVFGQRPPSSRCLAGQAQRKLVLLLRVNSQSRVQMLWTNE